MRVTLHRYWGFREGDVLVHMLPLFHVHGLFVACHTALLNGSMIRFHEKFDARRALADFADVHGVHGRADLLLRGLLAENALNREACSNMRLFISGSAPLLAETFEEFRARTGHVILERYGMTETGMLTSNPLDGERRGGTVGLPLPGVQVRVADEADRPLAPGEVGNVQVKGDNVLAGYWRMPEKDREEFTADRFFKTGDVGVFSADGYLSIVGRSKDLIITGGFNVYPKEIELAIDELPGVLESAVIGLPHADFGEAVTAVVVPRKGAPALIRRRHHCRAQGEAGQFQGAQARGLPRGTAAQHHGEGAEERIAQAAGRCMNLPSARRLLPTGLERRRIAPPSQGHDCLQALLQPRPFLRRLVCLGR